MTLTDDESDLSETLSSAGSTVPLPSSELGSRAASEDPPSPSGLASSSKNVSKFDRRRKSRLMRSKNNHPDHPLPNPNPDQKDPKSKRSRPATRPIAHPGSSCSVPSSDRSVKAESLPPPNLENGISRANLSSIVPRPSSAKGTVFEPKPHTDFLQNPTGSSNLQPRHPCTSHGHLPLFEQPVLVQGARPRRKRHLMTLTTKSTKGRKPRGANKSQTPEVDSTPLNHSNVELDGSTTPKFTETFKDEESSLTEQSSSDEASLTDRQPIQTPIGATSSRQPSQSLEELDPGPLASSSKDPWPHPSHQSSPTSPNSIKRSLLPCDDSLVVTTSSVDSADSPIKPIDSILPSSSHDLNPLEISRMNSGTPCSHPVHPHPDIQPQNSTNTACRVDQVNGRKNSEESALTPDPEEVGRPSTAPSPKSNQTLHTPSNRPCPTSPSQSESYPVLTICTSPPQRRSPSDPAPQTLKSSAPSLPADLLSSLAEPNHKPRPPNIIPPSNLGTCAMVDRTVESNLNPAVCVTDRPSSSTALLDHHSQQDTFPQQPAVQLEDLADNALDGEPITDDLMEYDLELIDDEPTLEALLNPPREPSEAGTSAVDGVPVPTSEDPIEDLETQPSLVPQSTIPPTFSPEPDFPPPHPPPSPSKSKASPGSEQEIPEPRPDKPKQNKGFSTGAIYEHDDHVRRREDALEAMVKIEIMFAQVRDRLYVERMADVHRETAAIQQGSHPELNEYCQMLERKRDARLSLAHKIFNLKEIELNNKREAATSSVWTKWHEAKTELHDSMISETQKQMKQLERERCQPDLRYNVEVQLLPRPIIPRISHRTKSRKRARLDFDEASEEILAIQLHTAIAKRATVNLSTLTAEECWADLSVMKPQSRTAHLDPVHILCAPSHPNPTLTGYARGPRSELSSELTQRLNPSVEHCYHKPDSSSCTTVDPAVAGAEKLIALNPKSLLPSRTCSSSQSLLHHLGSPSPSSEMNLQHPSAPRLNGGGLESLSPNILATSCSSRTVRSSSQRHSKSFDQTETNVVTDPNRTMTVTSCNGYSKSDRRPTLDSVMAHNHSNTPERLKAYHPHPHLLKGTHHNGSLTTGGDSLTTTCGLATSNPSSTACLGSSPSQISHHHHHHSTSSNLPNNPARNHPTPLYPPVPISVHYHERVKTQIA